jgi:transcriptional regulator with XRE-family HTH domain
MQTRIRNMGAKIRQIRREKGVTLKEIAARTNLSVSLISMIERGEANPSIGSLIAISDSLRIPASELFGNESDDALRPVIKKEEQAIVHVNKGVSRRLLVIDQKSNLQMAENTYEPGATSADTATRHRGKEFGVVLEGNLLIEVGGQFYTLEAGDAIIFDPQSPHRFTNKSSKNCKTIWVNIFSD